MNVVDPDIQAMLDEANWLPDCAAADAIFERVARRAESFGDLDTAWSARCRILSSSASHASPKFETLFLCLAWCLAVSDKDPDRFKPSSVLWQYKWVATAAPKFASVPRDVLERIIDDMDERFAKAGWGRRAGAHKRAELYSLLGEQSRARELVEPWQSIPRDRGSDCLACETTMLVDLLAELRDDERAVREAKPIIRGRLRCATVPHTTFGLLLQPLVRLGRIEEASGLYERGRRLVAAMNEGACMCAGPYLVFGARAGALEDVAALYRTHARAASAMPSDVERLRWFGALGAGMEMLHRRGMDRIGAPVVAGLTEHTDVSTLELAARSTEIARAHAVALDSRNGNTFYHDWLDGLRRDYTQHG